MYSNDKNSKVIKSVFLFAYFFIVIVTEQLYRDSLFLDSIFYIKLYNQNLSDLSRSYYRVISELGHLYIQLPILLILIIWFPLNKAYTYTHILSLSIFLNGLSKLIYGNPRPFWSDNSINQLCQGGYGNPSGHAMGSSAIYLSLANILTDYDYFKSENFILKFFIYLLAVIIFLTVSISGVILGVHGINQVIYGGLLGIGIYMFYFHILIIHKFNGKKFFAMFTNVNQVLFHTLGFLIFGSISLILYIFIEHNDSLYENNLKRVCPNLNPISLFKTEAFTGCLILNLLLGSYFSLMLFGFWIKCNHLNYEDVFINWHQKCENNIKECFRILISISFYSIPLLLASLISYNAPTPIIFIFKYSLPYFVISVLLFGSNVYICSKMKIIKTDMKNEYMNVLMQNEE